MKNSRTKVYEVKYTKAVGGEGTILVKADSREAALKTADYLCFTGSGFRDAKEVESSLYKKSRKQGFQGSERM